jgi:hypothetical protein
MYVCHRARYKGISLRWRITNSYFYSFTLSFISRVISYFLYLNIFLLALLSALRQTEEAHCA